MPVPTTIQSQGMLTGTTYATTLDKAQSIPRAVRELAAIPRLARPHHVLTRALVAALRIQLHKDGQSHPHCTTLGRPEQEDAA